MRSLGFDAPEELRADEHTVVVDIYVETPGEDDSDGNPQPPQHVYYVQDASADLQPRSGTVRAAQSGTQYESSHVLFLWQLADVPTGAKVDVKAKPGGEVIGTYSVVFVASWGTHLEIDLQAVEP